MITEQDVNDIYDNLIEATIEYENASEHEIQTRARLEVMRANLLASGTIDGRNAEIREAQAREILTEEYEALEEAEHDARYRKHELDLARIEEKRVRLLVRLDEIVARTLP